MNRRIRFIASLTMLALLGACATQKQPSQYGAFRNARPASIVIMPPLNESPDLKAGPAILSHAIRPLAEGGYYVLPVTMVEETFRQNGVQSAHDAQGIPFQKLREIFGADAALYMRVTEYGSVYQVLQSTTSVAVEARLVDLRDGTQLWTGKARAASSNNSGAKGGLLGMLVSAAVAQVANSASDVAYQYSANADAQLLTPHPGGLLYGPRSPRYGSDAEW